MENENVLPTVKKVREKALEYANKEWANDFTGNLIDYAKKDFIEGAEWFRSQITKEKEELPKTDADLIHEQIKFIKDIHKQIQWGMVQNDGVKLNHLLQKMDEEISMFLNGGNSNVHS